MECVAYIADEMKFGGLIKASLSAQTFLAKFMVDLTKMHSLPAPLLMDLNKKAQEIAHLGIWAADEALDGYPTVGSHIVVNMWNYIYGAVHDTIGIIILKDQKALAIVFDTLGKKLKAAPLDESDYGFIAQRYVNKFVKVEQADFAIPKAFKALGLEFPDKRDFSLIEEVRCIRNCIVHNSGAIDEHARTRCPNLKSATTTKEFLTPSRVDSYSLHLSNFVSELSDATLDSVYMPKSAPPPDSSQLDSY